MLRWIWFQIPRTEAGLASLTTLLSWAERGWQGRGHAPKENLKILQLLLEILVFSFFFFTLAHPRFFFLSFWDNGPQGKFRGSAPAYYAHVKESSGLI